jgi:UDP-N-acetylmuramate: L-alanyl-gamma-D-glutamyl-meso-diaminopimelate ligase
MRIHCIAVGGAIMHQLAIALKNQGHIVTGSDDEIFDPAFTNLLKHEIITHSYHFNPDNITKEIELIILGMHARKDNPELIKALELNIPIVSFPQYISNHEQSKTRLVVAGSHGKTTTTAMIMHVMKQANFSFDYLVGASLNGFNTTVHLSPNTPYIVLEGDEYFSSCLDPQPKFNWYKPHIAILTGISWDHINVYPSFEKYLKAFADFIQIIEKGGYIIYNEKDSYVTQLVSHYGTHLTAIPYNSEHYEYKEDKTYALFNQVKIPVSFFGAHNFSNMAAAHEVAKILEISDESFFAAMAEFKLPSKRLECIYNKDQIIVYRDFAHAPSKVKATIHAIRDRYPNSKLIAVLELHTYSSMDENFLPQYAHSLDEASKAIIYISHHAFEIKKKKMMPVPLIHESFQRNDVLIATKPEELIQTLKKEKEEYLHQVYLFMSSGNFDNLNFNLLFN